MFFVPDFKGYDFFPHGTRIDFMRFKSLCLGMSAALTFVSLALVAGMGLNFGVDFKGGTLIEVRSETSEVNVDQLRDRLGGLGLGDVQIQEIGSSELDTGGGSARWGRGATV